METATLETTTTTYIPTYSCKRGPEGESVFDCAGRHGLASPLHRVAVFGRDAQPGETLAAWIRVHPGDAPYPVYKAG